MEEIAINDISCEISNNGIKNERGLRQYLSSENFPPALQDFLIDDIKKTSMRYFICDDSGSMQERDGSKYNISNGTIINCTRWNELLDTIKFQIYVSNKGLINSKFMFLNGGTLEIGTKELKEEDYDSYFTLTGGSTPLCKILNKIIDEIKPCAEYYRNNHKSVVIVISTDGEASDGDVKIPLRELKDLPVTVILRLCTSENNIVNYWNNIDKELELKLDIVDDYISEANELKNTNKWLTYGSQLHRTREFGLVSNEIDKLDEIRTKDNDSLVTVSRIIFGKDNLPEGSVLTNEQIDVLNKKFEFKTFDPLTGKEEYWIKNTAIVKNGCSCCIQ